MRTEIGESARQHLVAATKYVQSVWDKIGTSKNNRNQSPPTTVGTKETISFSKGTTDTGTTRGSVRKTSRKKTLTEKRKKEGKRIAEGDRTTRRQDSDGNGW